MNTTRETADHAELAAMKPDDILAILRADRLPECSFDNGMTWVTDDVIVAETFERAADVLENLLSEIAALRGERDRIAGESIWWKGVIGDGSHQPSGEVPSIKHMHPAMVKPIYDAHKGTAVADVIAGLIFSLAITQNREQFLVKHANDRATQAERQRDEAFGLLRELADGRSQKNNINEYDDLSVRASALIANQGADQ